MSVCGSSAPLTSISAGRFCGRIGTRRQFPKIGATGAGKVPPQQLIQVVEAAAQTGAKFVMEAVNKPRNVAYKGLTDLVTDTDKSSEEAILEVLCCFGGCLYRGKPAAASVVEFVGGPMCWNTRMFSATSGGGAFCNGRKIHVSQTDQVERSLLVTGFGYEHDEAWATNIELFKQFTDVSRGVRRLGAAAVDMCHVALGIVEAYWEYRLKPWDMAAGVLIVEEAGGAVSRMDGEGFCVFDRSVLVSNNVIHSKLLERIAPATENLKNNGTDFSLWFKPDKYRTDL
ncbi:unnamed protein product [Rhodiola kirilowii]